MRNFSKKVYLLGLFFVVLVAANTFQSFHHLETTLRNEAERGIEYKLAHILTQITADLDHAENLLTSTEMLLRADESYDHLLEYFLEVMARNPALFSIFLGTPENRIVHSSWQPPADFDVRIRPWYQQAIQEERLVYTIPYLNAYDGYWVITMAKPVYGSSGQNLGVIGIDFTLEGVLALLEVETVSENGFSFFLDQKGDLIQNPNLNKNGENAISLDDVLISQLLKEPSGHVVTTIRGEKGYLRWQRLEGAGFTIGTFAPWSDFFNRRVQSIHLITVSAVSLVLAFSMLFFFQNHYVIKPVKVLEQDILRISLDKHPGYRLNTSEKESFKELREVIDVVLDQTQKQYENIVFQQEELSAAYAQLIAHEEQLQAQETEIKEHEIKSQFLENHDPMTGLFNRKKFRQDLSEALKLEQMGAVIMFDLDDFKHINDTQGHLYGDRVLRSIAIALKKKMKPNEIAYRLGGDEFLVVVQDTADPKKVVHTIERINDCLSEVSVVNKQLTPITSSMGIVRYPFDGTTVDELSIRVDLAMYHAKQGGKNRYTFFESGMATSFSERVMLERVLVEAIQMESFRLLYQPIIDATTGKVNFLEALIRIQDNPLSPAVFIAVAEESNLILPIGRWVIKEAIAQLGRWKDAGLKLVPISINLSAKQFYDDGLVEFLEEQLELSGVDPSLIEMEITETVLIDNAQEAIEIIESIRRLGIKMALDDFGTGYSSINYITRIPVDRIKLDRSMTEKLIENITVMKGLVSIAHGLGMDVVAEGVEKPEEADLLIEVGCDYLQGYLFSPPIPPDEVGRIMDMNFGRTLGLEDE